MCPGCSAELIAFLKSPTKSHTLLPFQAKESAPLQWLHNAQDICKTREPLGKTRGKMYLRPVPVGQLLINQRFDASFQHVDVRVPGKHEGDVSTLIQTACKPPSMCLGNSSTSRLP